MKKLISAATSLAMAATMVAAAVPVAVSAADTTKGFSIKTYDAENPSAASGKNTITINQEDIGADGYVIPTAVYYSEATVNTTDSLLVSLTTDSKDISFKYYDPGADSYFSEAKSYTLGGVDFKTDRYISWAGFCKNSRTGYKPAGEYVFGIDSSQSAAGTDNYFLGCSWMNKGVDYAWAGTTSDAYPFYVFETKLSSNIKPGTYHVTYCDYNTDASGVNDNPCPMVEGDGSRYTLKAQNGDKQLKTEDLTIVVKGKDDVTTPVTQAPVTQPTTTATTPVVTDVPVSGDIKFEFVDADNNNSSLVEVPVGTEKKINVDVNIDAGSNAVSALDVQFRTSGGGIKVSDILDSAMAFEGKTVSTNLAELRANYATLKGDTPIVPANGKSAFMLEVTVPANTPEGTYTVDFAQCKIFKDNTKFNYETGVKPLTIKVGKGGDVSQTVTTATTTKAPSVTTTVANPNAAVKFSFVDADNNNSNTVEVASGAAKTINVDVNIEAGTNAISALDVQFQATKGIQISDILDSAMAFEGKTVSTNLAELRANYATLKGDTPIVPANGKSAFMLEVKVPAGTPDGVYTVDFAQCKIFKDNTKFNYEVAATPLTIKVGNVTTTKASGTTTTTAPVTDKPVTETTTVNANADVKFSFVDADNNNSNKVEVASGAAKTINVDVNIEAGTNAISALDVQFRASNGIQISDILDSAMAFEGKTVSTNLTELRANYATLKGDTPIVPANGKSAFMLEVKVPAGTPDGTYTVDFAQCKIFKDNTKFNYEVAVTPLTIVVGQQTTTSTSKTTTTAKTTTTTKVTETTPVSTTTPTTGTKLNVTLWGDTNCNGEVNVADVVVLNRLLNDPSYIVKNPDTKADVTAQGKVNADVVAPQSKDGKNIDPATVKLTAADSEAIAMYILEKGSIPTD